MAVSRANEEKFSAFFWITWTLILLLLFVATIAILVIEREQTAQTISRLDSLVLASGLSVGTITSPPAQPVMPVSAPNGTLRFTNIQIGDASNLNSMSGVNDLFVKNLTMFDYQNSDAGTVSTNFFSVNPSFDPEIIDGTTYTGYSLPSQQLNVFDAAIGAKPTDVNMQLSWVHGKGATDFAMVGVERIVTTVTGIAITPSSTVPQTVSRWSTVPGNSYQSSQGDLSVLTEPNGGISIITNVAGNYWVYFDVQATVTSSSNFYDFSLTLPSGLNDLSRHAFLYQNTYTGTPSNRPMNTSQEYEAITLPAGTPLTLQVLAGQSAPVETLNIDAWKIMAVKL